MKLKVKIKFRDKYTKEIYKAGTVLDNVSQERYKEICETNKNLLEIIEENAEPETEPEAEPETKKRGRGSK